MAIDIKDSTSNVDPRPFIIPTNSDFYRIKQGGRLTVPEAEEQTFVTRFADTSGLSKRDYKHLQKYLWGAATRRGYALDRNFEDRPTTVILRKLWKETGRNIHLFCDVICAAINDCPTTDENIYQ